MRIILSLFIVASLLWRVCTSLSILSYHLPVNKKTSTLRIPEKEFAKVVAVYVYKIYDKF
jgi:hypothetical protein